MGKSLRYAIDYRRGPVEDRMSGDGYPSGMSEQYALGDRVRLTDTARLTLGDYKVRDGTVVGLVNNRDRIAVLWDGLKVRQSYARYYVERADDRADRSAIEERSQMSDEQTYRFAKAADGCPSLDTDERIALLAVCIAHQQAAGFGTYIDLRQASCGHCGAPGFNTGFGAWLFTCSAEVLSDGTESEPCTREAVS